MSEKFQQAAGFDRFILGKSTLISTSTLNIPMPRRTAPQTAPEQSRGIDHMKDEFTQRLSLTRDNFFASRLGLANTLFGLGIIAEAKADYDLARRRFQEALDVFHAQGMRANEADCLKALGDLALKQHDHNEGERLFAAALDLYRQLEVQSSGPGDPSDEEDSVQSEALGERRVP
jgi:tetratricopeptide (TPR) repeat protein